MNGWTLEKGYCTIVNTPDCGNGRYKVGIWSGEGYYLPQFLCYADSAEEALDQVVVYLERVDSSLLQDKCYNDNVEYEMQEHGLSYDEACEYLDNTFMWVDATMSGARRPHYIYFDNLRIETVPEQYYDWFDAA